MIKNLQNHKGKWRGKFKKLINKKPPNLVGTVEENEKIVDTLILLALGVMLRMNEILI